MPNNSQARSAFRLRHFQEILISFTTDILHVLSVHVVLGWVTDQCDEIRGTVITEDY